MHILLLKKEEEVRYVGIIVKHWYFDELSGNAAAAS
jgi:hypothetical protein